MMRAGLVVIASKHCFIAAWLVIGRGAADQSYNTRVEARNQKVYVLYSNGYWAQVSSGRPAGRRRLNTPFDDAGPGDEFAVDYATSSINAPVGFLHEMWAGVPQLANWYTVIGFFATAICAVTRNDGPGLITAPICTKPIETIVRISDVTNRLPKQPHRFSQAKFPGIGEQPVPNGNFHQIRQGLN